MGSSIVAYLYYAPAPKRLQEIVQANANTLFPMVDSADQLQKLMICAGITKHPSPSRSRLFYVMPEPSAHHSGELPRIITGKRLFTYCCNAHTHTTPEDPKGYRSSPINHPITRTLAKSKQAFALPEEIATFATIGDHTTLTRAGSTVLLAIDSWIKIARFVPESTLHFWRKFASRNGPAVIHIKPNPCHQIHGIAIGQIDRSIADLARYMIGIISAGLVRSITSAHPTTRAITPLRRSYAVSLNNADLESNAHIYTTPENQKGYRKNNVTFWVVVRSISMMQRCDSKCSWCASNFWKWLKQREAMMRRGHKGGPSFADAAATSIGAKPGAR